MVPIMSYRKENMKTHYGVMQINTMEYILKFHKPVPLCQPNLPAHRVEKMKFGSMTYRSVVTCKRCLDRGVYKDELRATIMLEGYRTR